jgi:hypothetical protein
LAIKKCSPHSQIRRPAPMDHDIFPEVFSDNTHKVYTIINTFNAIAESTKKLLDISTPIYQLVNFVVA